MKTINFVSLVTLMFLLASCTASPVKVAPKTIKLTMAAPDTVATDDRNQKICKEVTETGSRISIETCKTKQQWVMDAEADKQKVKNNVQPNSTNPRASGGMPVQ